MLQFILFGDLDIPPVRNLHLAHKLLNNRKRMVVLIVHKNRQVYVRKLVLVRAIFHFGTRTAGGIHSGEGLHPVGRHLDVGDLLQDTVRREDDRAIAVVDQLGFRLRDLCWEGLQGVCQHVKDLQGSRLGGSQRRAQRNGVEASAVRGFGGEIDGLHQERYVHLLLPLPLGPGRLDDGEMLGLHGRECNENVRRIGAGGWVMDLVAEGGV